MKKRKTQPWVCGSVTEGLSLFRGDDRVPDFHVYCQRFWMGSVLDQALCCVAYIQTRKGTATFTDVMRGFKYHDWKENEQQVQDAIYALASARQGRLFHMKLDGGKTLVLRGEVLSYLDTLTKYCSPSRVLKGRFADKE